MGSRASCGALETGEIDSAEDIDTAICSFVLSRSCRSFAWSCLRLNQEEELNFLSCIGPNEPPNHKSKQFIHSAKGYVLRGQAHPRVPPQRHTPWQFRAAQTWAQWMWLGSAQWPQALHREVAEVLWRSTKSISAREGCVRAVCRIV